MAMYKIPVTKGKSFVELESDNLPETVYRYCFFLGAKAVINRMATVTKSKFDSDEEFRAAAMVKAAENVQAMMDGKTRIVGMKTDKISGEVMTEARRLARLDVKAQIKEAGEKITDYAASDITQAANGLIASDPAYLETAKANVEARHSKATTGTAKIDIKTLPKNPKKVATKAKANEEAKAETSATKVQGQAGLSALAGRGRPGLGQQQPRH